MAHLLNVDKLGDVDVDGCNLRLRAFSGYEELSRLFIFRLEMDLPQENVPDLSADKVLGRRIVFSVSEPTVSYFSGIVNSFSMGNLNNKGRRFCTVQVVPELWKLTQMMDSIRFPTKTVAQLVEDVVKGADLDLQLDDRTTADDKMHPPRSNPVQYDETLLNFLARHMEEEGIFYYFRENYSVQGDDVQGNQHLVLGDRPNAYHPLEVEDDDESKPLTLYFQPTANVYTADLIPSWERRFNFRPATWTINDYDYNKSQDFNMVKSADSWAGPAGGGYRKFKRSAGFYDKDYGDSLLDSMMRKEELQREYVRGQSFCPSLFPGSKFTLAGHPAEGENGDYVITSIEHHAAEYGVGDNTRFEYENTFTCVPADRVATSCPHATSSEPLGSVRGSSTARSGADMNTGRSVGAASMDSVVNQTYREASYGSVDTQVVAETAFVCDSQGEFASSANTFGTIHTDSQGYGRVLIRFPWETPAEWRQAGANSRWVRTIQMFAGNNWGAKFLPRVGEEVIVLYIDGVNKKPVIVGSVYNSDANHARDVATKMDLVKTRNYSGGGWSDASSPRTEFFGVSTSPGTHRLADGIVDDGTGGTTDNRHVGPSLSASDVSGLRTRTNQGTLASDVVGNQLLFKDTPNDEEIYIHAEEDLNINVKGDMNVAIGGNKKEYIAGDYYRVVKCKDTSTNGPVNRSVTGALTFDLDATWGYTTFKWNSDDDIHPVTVYTEEYLDTESRREGDATSVHVGTTSEFFMGGAFTLNVSAEEHVHVGAALNVFAGLTTYDFYLGALKIDLTIAFNLEMDESVKFGINSGLDYTKKVVQLDNTDTEIKKIKASIQDTKALVEKQGLALKEAQTSIRKAKMDLLQTSIRISKAQTMLYQTRTILMKADVCIFP